MKKSLLALAVLGAFAAGAQAQTNVSIGGVVQANFKSYSVGGVTLAGRNTTRENRIDDDYNSRFWLTGSEDLGGGLSAIFYVENRFRTDSRVSGTHPSETGLADGDTWLGLKGSWGQVTVGKHSWMSVQGLLTELQVGNGGLASMPTSMLGTYTILNQVNGAYLDVSRRVNSITYRSPNFNGFSGTIGVSTSSGGNEGTCGTALAAAAGSPQAFFGTFAGACAGTYSDGREYYLQGNYTNGPLYLNLAYRNNTTEGSTTGASQKQVRFSGFYKISGWKLGLQLDRATNDTSTTSFSRTAWSLPISYAMGNNTILFSYTKAGDYAGVASSGAKMFTLGWDYALSKRTNVGVYYSKLSNDTGAAYQPFLAAPFTFTGSGLLAGETASTFALGLKHTF